MNDQLSTGIFTAAALTPDEAMALSGKLTRAGAKFCDRAHELATAALELDNAHMIRAGNDDPIWNWLWDREGYLGGIGREMFLLAEDVREARRPACYATA